jgi:TonB family protein
MMRKNLWIVPMLTLAASFPAVPGWARQTAGEPPAQVVAAPPKKVMVSSGVAQRNRIGGDMPVYPAIAKAAHVEGTVVLQATIAKEGTIENLRVISGPAMLQQAAIDAVHTWTYKPYLLNGEPVEVETQVNVVFSLDHSGSATAPAGNGEASEQASPASPEVQELMDLTGMAALQRQMVQQMMPTLRQAMPPYMPDDVFEDFQNRILGGDMQALIVKAYQNHVSTEDAAEMIAFYKTPAGHRSIQMMPMLMQELQAAGAKLGQDTMEKVLEQHSSEIEAAKQKYEQQHPWSAPKS